MIKKRTRPQPRIRERSLGLEDEPSNANSEDGVQSGEGEEKLE